MSDPIPPDNGDPLPVEAAGGIVIRKFGAKRQSPSTAREPDAADSEVLMIYRRGAWDLPKGKIDSGETPAECAIREVEEETGAVGLQIVSGAGLTIHNYYEGGRKVIKTTWWFVMTTTSDEFVPESGEQIDDVRWMAWPEAVEAAGFPNLRRHLKSLASVVRTLDLTQEGSSDTPA